MPLFHVVIIFLTVVVVVEVDVDDDESHLNATVLWGRRLSDCCRCCCSRR